MLEILWICYLTTNSLAPQQVKDSCIAQDRLYAPYTMVLTQNSTTKIYTLTITNRQARGYDSDFQIALLGNFITLQQTGSWTRATFTQERWYDKGVATPYYLGKVKFRLNGPTIPTAYTLDPVPSNGFCATRCLPIPAPTVSNEVLTFNFKSDATVIPSFNPTNLTICLETINNE